MSRRTSAKASGEKQCPFSLLDTHTQLLCECVLACAEDSSEAVEGVLDAAKASEAHTRMRVPTILREKK